MSENNGICEYLPHKLLDDPELLGVLRKPIEPGEIPITGDWHKICEYKKNSKFCPFVREILFYKGERRFGVPVACVKKMKEECGDYSL